MVEKHRGGEGALRKALVTNFIREVIIGTCIERRVAFDNEIGRVKNEDERDEEASYLTSNK